ncbi:hypothetical protein [Undibacterium sp. TS12]|uniref:hypothetical protein n=1 Tax=Undibacterium sp. TS12 TaxID=2908202 RepID=UPI001F4D02EB|nr:hypothetical protein [Undibacterium sp. TS12]MCH8619212.1 hypothetical protein [Undibacterium sp. TS12]
MQLLNVIPEFTALEPFRDNNLNTWRTQGAHSLLTSTKNSIVLSVNQREYASTLFSEAQHLLNHASEHRAHLLDYKNIKDEPSPSWVFVSLYYFSLFIAMAWTRVANGAVLYLDKEAIIEYCGSASIKPGGGAYKASLALDSTTGAAKVNLRKCSTSHFHEAVWIAVSNEVESAIVWIISLSNSRKPTSEELLSLRALNLFRGLSFNDPLVWPSMLRNAINYRPGYSYRTVINHNFLRIRSRLERPSFLHFEELVAFGERAKSATRGVAHPSEIANDSVELLIAQSLVLESFTEDALASICDVRNLESSAGRLRQRFNRKYCNTNSILAKVTA